MKKKMVAIILAAMMTLSLAGTAFAEPSGGPPNPSGQCPTGNTPGCSPHFH